MKKLQKEKYMALSNNQLLMLDNLIYTNYCGNNKTIQQIINEIDEDKLNNSYNINTCEMTSQEWEELINEIKSDPVLFNYRVTNYVNDESTGMRAACFVDDENNPSDVNVVFRGTSGDKEWHDNGQGGYLADTPQQISAAEYVNSLPNKYGNHLTVTGHSKGGNKAQYVTIVTDRIARCVSFDGQGFSKEFLEKYSDDITKKSQIITSISAKYDFVNCLLYPIAGTKIYVDTDTQENYLHYHKPNILLRNIDNPKCQSDEPAEISKFINEYTTYMISNLSEPERSITVDGLISFLEQGDDKENIIQFILAGTDALSHLDDFAFDYIGKEYGYPAEYSITLVAAAICPFLFADDLIICREKHLKKQFEDAINKMIDFSDTIKNRLYTFGEKCSDFTNTFVSAITDFISKIKNQSNQIFNYTQNYVFENPEICVDTNKLRYYGERLSKINLRINDLDKRLRNLYNKVGFSDLFTIIQSNILLDEVWKIEQCIKYLEETASDFDSVEREITANCNKA